MIPLDVTPVPASSLDRLRVIVVERGLRGAVGREMRVWRDSVSRRDLDQTPPAALFHRRSKGMDQSNRGDRVLMVVVDPFLKGGVEPRVVGLLNGIADVIHEDIDAVESRFGPPSITAFDPSSVVTSPRTNFASPPSLRISSVTAAARSALLPLMTTLTPSPARTRAHCAPIPEVLPVISARFPFNNISMFTTL